MRKTTLEYIVLGTEGELYATDRTSSEFELEKVVIDSRNAKEGTMFFCIIGEKVDAHRFLPDVREAGCKTVVVSDIDWANKMKALGDMNVILVPDTTMALVKLGTKYMDDWDGVTRVAITGSVGKTSTKEFMYSILSSKYKTGKNAGNFNSEFGIPLTCFDFDEDIEFAINEIGLGYGLDMKYLVNIVKPDAAIITNIFSSHLEAYGSRDELRNAKLRITTALKDGGTLVVNSDCDQLKKDIIRANTSGDFNIVTVGSDDEADYKISDICDNGIDGVKCTLEINGHEDKYTLVLPVVGAHNLFNAALAIAVASGYGIETEEAIAALSHTVSYDNRLDVRRGEMHTVINDCYNASPESMKAGIDVVIKSDAARRGAILGDMFELGDDSYEMHKSVGTYAASKGLDFVVTIGSNSLAIAEGAKEANPDMLVVSYATRDEAEADIENVLKKGDVVLVKASRSMELEVLSDAISL